jgi:hypothetical protein
VFEDWPVTMCPPTRRVVDPPKPVFVDLSRLIVNTDDTFRRDEVALRNLPPPVLTLMAGPFSTASRMICYSRRSLTTPTSVGFCSTSSGGSQPPCRCRTGP